MQTVLVIPIDEGWVVRSENTRDLVFDSGHAAEVAALTVAEEIALRGDPAQIKVLLPDGAVARRFAVPPPDVVGQPFVTSAWEVAPASRT